jgi:hypothetical protein
MVFMVNVRSSLRLTSVAEPEPVERQIFAWAGAEVFLVLLLIIVNTLDTCVLRKVDYEEKKRWLKNLLTILLLMRRYRYISRILLFPISDMNFSHRYRDFVNPNTV